MSVVSFILVHLITWLIMFFISLPFGVKVPDKPEKGNANSAPINTNLKLKLFKKHMTMNDIFSIIYFQIEVSNFLRYLYINNFIGIC